jgi:hypothetical protein
MEKTAVDLLWAKVRAVRCEDGEDLDNLGSILGVHKLHSDGIPDSVLSAVPQLTSLSAAIGDNHLQETFCLRCIFSSEKALDPTIDVMQQQQLDVTIPRSLWKDIIQDHFVNSEKLFASMDVGYGHSEVPKDFHGRFILVKKDQLVAKRPSSQMETGCEYSVLGKLLSVLYTLIECTNFNVIKSKSWTYFSWTQTILSHGFVSMLKYGSDMRSILFTWMIATTQTLTCSLICSGLLRNVQVGRSSPLSRIRSVLRLFVTTGTSASVLIHANGNESMECAVNVEESIKLRTSRSAKLVSKFDRERELLLVQE